MSELRTLIKGWLDENAKEYYGISMENANAALWAFEDALDKMDEMQKALEWYADEENYKRSEDDHQTGYPHEIMWDKGSKARQALKGNQ